MYLVACGVRGFGDWICETDSGRPFGMSTVIPRLSRRDSRLDEDECLESRWERFEELEVLSLLECFELDFEDLSWGTSRIFKLRPVVGSVV